MGDFTISQIQNITASALDFYVKGKAMSQVIQKRPLMDDLLAKQKFFPGGKGNISIPIKGNYSTTIQGFSGDQQVGFVNPSNNRRAVFPWREHHAGISFTMSELKIDGISITDSATGAKTSNHSERDVTVLTGILDEKLEDMSEGWGRSFDAICHYDGSQDPLVMPGLLAFFPDDPTSGVLGGIDRAANAYWRHRTLVGASKITASPTNQTLTLTLRAELRMLRKYGGDPRKAYCGSRFLEGLESEVHAKGIYTQTGFASKGRINLGMAEPELDGIEFVYDPQLDDIGYSKRAYLLDLRRFGIWTMEGEDRKTHNPARPHDRYVVYRSMTSTCGMALSQPNSCGVYEIA